MIPTTDLPAFIKSNQRTLKGYIGKYYPQLRQEDIEDILQNLYMEFLEEDTLSLYNPKKGSFDNWIYKILRHKCSTHIRDNRAHNLECLDHYLNLTVPPPDLNQISDFLKYVQGHLIEPLRSQVVVYIISRTEPGYELRQDSMIYKTYKRLRDRYLKGDN